MESFEQLLSVADRLLGPGGCPWDREQTLYTLQPYLLEETHELIEAIDSLDGDKIAEELGDVFYALVFVARLGEKEGLFTLSEALQKVGEKLIRRHPHVFGDVKAETSDEIIKNWDEIKKKEFQGRKSALDGIPPTLPALARAQKVLVKIARAEKRKGKPTAQTEGEWGEKFWTLLEEAEANGWNSEDLVRRLAKQKEEDFREREKTPEMNS